MTETLFQDIVGQDAAKKKLSFYLKSYNATRIMPNLMLCAPKGQGKSTIAKETAKGLVKFNEDNKVELKEDGVTPRKKAFVEINASAIKNVKQFINSVIIPHVVDKDVTIFIDEASEISKDVTMSLLTMLNPNPSNKNTFVYDDYACDIDFSRQTFIFATSESHSVFAPLMDRLTRIDLEDYTYENLAEILRKSAKEVTFKDQVEMLVASTLRGNARQAVKRSNEIKAYLCGEKTFGMKEWKELQGVLSILPNGLSPIELNLMRYMKDAPEGSSLTNLAAKTGLSRDTVQKDYEIFLQKLGFMEITAGKGRTITAKGLNYLKELDNPNFTLTPCESVVV
jgi:Holliday junction resolvasome RuvABC ATP-dependent DNA helicase subunit